MARDAPRVDEDESTIVGVDIRVVPGGTPHLLARDAESAFVVGGLSLIGVPLTVGFISKWYLIQAVLERGWWPIAIIIITTSLLAVIYVWRVVEIIYFRAPSGAAAVATEAPVSLVVPTWILIGATLYFGIDATTTLDVAIAAARALIGGGS